MSVTDEYVENNARHAKEFTTPLQSRPARQVAIVACMDARMNPYKILGLADGDAHIIRNAGGVVTDDVIRSLTISQRHLGTTEIMVVQHTSCGMMTFTEDGFKRSLQDEVGIKPAWAVESFTDLDENVRQSVARIKASPFLPQREGVRGFVYDVATGQLREVG